MRVKSVIAASAGLVLAILIFGGAWYLVRRPPEYCQLSGRLIHPHMLTVVKIKGKTRYACCARCALTYEEQTGIHTEILQVSDYSSGRLIDAQKAYFVSGSHVEPDCVSAVGREEGRTPYVRMFDRCSPSLIAFISRDEAQAFVARNGGRVAILEELENQAKSAGQGVHHD
jgi:hypothetical protein